MPGNLYNDLAIVTLQDKVETEKFSHIGTICLPHHAQVYYDGIIDRFSNIFLSVRTLLDDDVLSVDGVKMCLDPMGHIRTL